METEETYTSYCGLYCGDCIPSNRRLFSLVRDLESELVELRFEEYAALKAGGDATFSDYGRFLKVLRAIRSLECRRRAGQAGGRAAAQCGTAFWNAGCMAAGNARTAKFADCSIR